MRKHVRWMLVIVLIAWAITAAGLPQVSSPPPRPSVVSVNVQVVVTRAEGDKKVSSPYSFFTSSSGETSSLRLRGEIPVGAALEEIGTQIDASVTGDGRFNLMLNFKGRFLSSDGKPTDFTASNTFTLRDGESAKYTGSDSKGGAFTLDVTLSVVK